MIQWDWVGHDSSLKSQLLFTWHIVATWAQSTDLPLKKYRYWGCLLDFPMLAINETHIHTHTYTYNGGNSIWIDGCIQHGGLHYAVYDLYLPVLMITRDSKRWPICEI